MCRSSTPVQIDTIEATYPIVGVLRPSGKVVVDVERRVLDTTAIVEQFYRCGACKTEWPVEDGTEFVLPEAWMKP